MSTTSDSLVTIIVPFYSHPEHLPQAIESALGQTYTHLEVIIVDDGSPHDLDAVIQPYVGDARLRVIRQENGGVAKARNTAIQAAQGDFIQFLDSDDWLAPEKIARHVAALEAEPELGLVFCPFHFVEDGVISDPINPLHDPLWQAEDDQYFNTLWAANRMVVTGPLVRREWLVQTNGFDTSNLTEDYELWLRLAALGCKMRNLPDALVYYRINEQGRSKDGRARARKVATRARILTLFPELVAEATERAMETWQVSFDRLWSDRRGTIDWQAAELAKAKEHWEGLHDWSLKQQETIDQQAAELVKAKEHWDGLHEWSLKQQETIDRQAADLAEAQRKWEELHEWSLTQQETIQQLQDELDTRPPRKGLAKALGIGRAAKKIVRQTNN